MIFRVFLCRSLTRNEGNMKIQDIYYYAVAIITLVFLTTGSLGSTDTTVDTDNNSGYTADPTFTTNFKSLELRNLQRGISNNRTRGNNHKPVFINCANYSIEEEQDRGLHVTKVQATDADPPEDGGTVTYAIIQREGGRSQFNINNVTGEITTNVVFDRDEPTRQKELFLTVKAVDNGWPVLADICTLRITITDINDNAPNFDKLKNEESVSESLTPDREVMRVFAYDIDDGDNARLTYTLRSNGASDFENYFGIDNKTGVIYLKQSLVNKKGTVFTSQVVVNDNPIDETQRKENVADVKIDIVGSDKKLPAFVNPPKEPIRIKESFNDFDAALVNITAESRIDEQDLQFELIIGKTRQTNKESHFKLTATSSGTQAKISLGRQMDYERDPEFQLTVRIKNKDSLAATVQIDIEIEDVNDEIPSFIEIVSGSVLENEEPPAEVMQVRAIDRDGTSANNIVRYELLSHHDLFEIDKDTGKVTTKTEFDREAVSVYDVQIRAYDNSPSALLSRNEPNSVVQQFRITIEDRNDNKPEFKNSTYTGINIVEDADIGFIFMEVRAVDRDAFSRIEYRIKNGNVGDAFRIEPTTGRIRVNNKLDYEKIESYNLTVEASDGVYTDEALVLINIDNVNDEIPVFEPYDKDIRILEETIPETCIITLTAFDPDIRNRSAPQKIEYQVDRRYSEILSVDRTSGCVKLIKKLDRDKPNGSPVYQAFIQAYDDNNSANALHSVAEIYIHLDDINDNAPRLTNGEVQWMENRAPGDIVQLTAEDYDSAENGPPFSYSFASDVHPNITTMFRITGDILSALVTFDREERKFYDLPIAIRDSGTPTQEGVSILRVIIGDENDNAANDGASDIFVYNYKDQASNVPIGRVYVDDPDDWDLDDKVFMWKFNEHRHFRLDRVDGMLTMNRGTPEGNFTLNFIVIENAPPLIVNNSVEAVVVVTVKEISDEAVRKSGSMRLQGSTTEEFIARIGESSRKELLQRHLSQILNTSITNVDIFTVLVSPSNASLIDVRFSAHGSPYYAPERLNSQTSLNMEEIERTLGVNFVMISISECIKEDACGPENSCANRLNIKNQPAIVFTNRTSFVGVQAVVEAICSCISDFGQCVPYNNQSGPPTCVCQPGTDAPHCESSSIGFNGDGWAMYPPFQACNNSEIKLEIAPQNDNGLIFYAGPLSVRPMPLVLDFMSLELRNGFPVLLLNYGSGTTEVLLLTKKLTDGASHTISIIMSPKEVQLSVDDCHRSQCQSLSHPKGPNSLLNVNGPLQIGGTTNNLKELSTLLKWEFTPTSMGFHGCVRNLTFNGVIYNLGEPGEQKNALLNCNYGIKQAVTIRIDSNFLVALLVCAAILLILFLAVVVHRRKENNWNEKDTDDIRETIISYEDEGGGEVDTGYDMSVFPRMHEDEPVIKENLYKEGAEVPDISGFLDTKKDTCDRDPNSYPFDDVRYYAYEGDGNSTGSLSSLASCTDDGDLKFNYLSSFGPRFRKLADMYGEDPSDEDSHDGGEESWC